MRYIIVIWGICLFFLSSSCVAPDPESKCEKWEKEYREDDLSIGHFKFLYAEWAADCYKNLRKYYKAEKWYLKALEWSSRDIAEYKESISDGQEKLRSKTEHWKLYQLGKLFEPIVKPSDWAEIILDDYYRLIELKRDEMDCLESISEVFDSLGYENELKMTRTKIEKLRREIHRDSSEAISYKIMTDSLKREEKLQLLR